MEIYEDMEVEAGSVRIRKLKKKNKRHNEQPSRSGEIQKFDAKQR
jgi:hypothetical protein